MSVVGKDAELFSPPRCAGGECERTRATPEESEQAAARQSRFDSSQVEGESLVLDVLARAVEHGCSFLARLPYNEQGADSRRAASGKPGHITSGDRYFVPALQTRPECWLYAQASLTSTRAVSGGAGMLGSVLR